MDATNRNRGGNRAGRKNALALALAVGKTIKQAARAAGVSERTAQMWWTEPDFKARVAELRGEMVSRALGSMTDALTDAARTLRKLLKGANDAVRLGAARSLIDLALKVRNETEMEARLAAVEAHIGARKRGRT